MLNRTRGFTLIELLVVIAIIAITGSHSISHLPDGKEDRSGCLVLSNMKQIGIAHQFVTSTATTALWSLSPGNVPAGPFIRRVAGLYWPASLSK